VSRTFHGLLPLQSCGGRAWGSTLSTGHPFESCPSKSFWRRCWWDIQWHLTTCWRAYSLQLFMHVGSYTCSSSIKHMRACHVVLFLPYNHPATSDSDLLLTFFQTCWVHVSIWAEGARWRANIIQVPFRLRLRRQVRPKICTLLQVFLCPDCRWSQFWFLLRNGSCIERAGTWRYLALHDHQSFLVLDEGKTTKEHWIWHWYVDVCRDYYSTKVVSRQRGISPQVTRLIWHNYCRHDEAISSITRRRRESLEVELTCEGETYKGGSDITQWLVITSNRATFNLRQSVCQQAPFWICTPPRAVRSPVCSLACHLAIFPSHLVLGELQPQSLTTDPEWTHNRNPPQPHRNSRDQL